MNVYQLKAELEELTRDGYSKAEIYEELKPVLRAKGENHKKLKSFYTMDYGNSVKQVYLEFES